MCRHNMLCMAPGTGADAMHMPAMPTRWWGAGGQARAQTTCMWWAWQHTELRPTGQERPQTNMYTSSHAHAIVGGWGQSNTT